MASPIRFAYDRSVNAAYLHLTDQVHDLPGPTESISVDLPAGAAGEIVLDFRDGRLIGIEVLEADLRLPYDLLDSSHS